MIADLQNTYGSALHVVRCEVNRGLSYALNDGLTFCKHELVARMDSDDFAPADRCALQLRAFDENPDWDIVGGSIDEFHGDPANVISHKDMPLTYDEILRYAKSRNHFNHPTVMYRKSAVKFRYHLLQSGFYNLWNFLYVTAALAVVCLVPANLRTAAYKKVLRKN